MQKWEYCRVMCKVENVSEETRKIHERDNQEKIQFVQDGDVIIASQIIVNFMNSQAEPIYQKKLIDTFEQLGLAGWELISHSEVQQPTAIEVFYFKRPIEE